MSRFLVLFTAIVLPFFSLLGADGVTAQAAAANATFAAKVDSPTGKTPRGLTALDYNQDGRMDLVVVNNADSTVSLLKGNGTASFAADQTVGVTPPAAIAARDFDEDGQLDVVVSGQGEDIGASYVVLYKLAQSPPKASLGNLGATDAGQQIATADFNGDGHGDFAMTSPIGGALMVVLCNGNGTCKPSTSYAAGNLPFGVAAGDFNGDGKPDLAVTLNGENSVAVFLNNGDGTFAAPVKYPTGAGPTWVVTGDFRGTGKTDIAVVNGGAATVSILLGNGNGTFAAKVDYPAGSWAMASADFNGDGKLDLAVTNPTAGTVSILYGNGDGTFGTAQTLTAGNGPRNIVAADFDGDGAVDLAVANSTDNTVSVFLNTRITTIQAPYPAAVTPTVSAGASQVLTVTFGAFNGFQTLDVLNVLINTALDGRQACYLAYSRSGNALYIVNDNGDPSQITGKVMDGTGTVGNSQCSVALASSSATGSGNTFTLVLNMTFAAGFAGNKVIYAAARDATGRNSGWQTMGAHAVPVVPPPPFPAPISMSPTGGVTSTQTFTFTYQDQTAATNLQTVWALINTAVDGRVACYIAYYRPGNQVYLYPDNGDGSQATNIILTGTNTISNSQCTVSAAGSSVTANGATLTVVLPVTFKPAFAGHKEVFMAAQTLNAAQTSPWQALGEWNVPSQTVR